MLFNGHHRANVAFVRVVHQSEAEAQAHRAETGAAVGKPTPALPFPVEIDAKFALLNQNGEAVTEKDFAGKPMAIFFGYANCEAICIVRGVSWRFSKPSTTAR